MRWPRKSLWLLVKVCALTIPTAVAAAHEPDAARQQSLRYLVLQDCGSCHGMTLKGGLGSPLLPPDLAHTDTAALVEIILKGVPGTPMPGWEGLLSESEAAWIARELKEGKIAP